MWELLHVHVTKTAAKRIHEKLLHNVLHQPQFFFDTTPVGRILSRFSGDVNVLDKRLPYSIKILAPYSFRVRPRKK